MTELEAERNALLAEKAKLKTVMIAAAEEIQAHWDAHCDAEGYGPANLMRRLEEGIPSEYGYTAGAFAELRAQVEALRALLVKARDALGGGLWDYGPGQDEHAKCSALVQELSAAIDAAMKGTP